MSHALAPDVGFRRLLLLTLAAAGCSSKTPVETTTTVDVPPVPATPIEPPTPPQADDCDGPMFDDGSLNPAQPVDGIVLHRRRPERMENDTGTVIAQSGEFCSDDGDVCETNAAQLWQTEAIRRDCGQIGCTQFHLASSTGEAVAAIPSPEALLTFLGPIDTAAEARLVAWAARFDVACAPTADGDGWTVAASQYMSDCPMRTDQVSLTVSADGTLTENNRVVGPPGPCAGRLPPGLCNTPERDRTVGEWLANAAHMEAASVHAFEILAAELVAHNAPHALIQAARDAAEDERRHATIMGALAAARGATVLPADVAPIALRSLAEIANDNAAEGLGREAWGALLALWQSHNASDPEIRQAMQTIAWDEVRHAEFSRALHAWIAPKLSELERYEADAAREQAWSSLAADAGRAWAPGVAEALGMPTDPARLVAATRVAGIAA